MKAGEAVSGGSSGDAVGEMDDDDDDEGGEVVR